MESSEDDAGTATNASRRASAREKDVGLAEDVNATSSFQHTHKPSDARSSCQTPAMSEDNFDGDSVPSPSSQDVNTSTEAILDMIDEIVDGPDAPKRLPLTSDLCDALNEELATTSHKLNIIQESAKSECADVPLVAELTSSVGSAAKEVTLSTDSDKQAECSTHSDVPADNILPVSVDSLPASSSEDVGDKQAVSTVSEDSVVSSEEVIVQPESDISASELQDRTVKCVTSSDNRDNVTVESAESTSSDSIVSESKTLLVEPQVRSPLRRRLVRPAPSDRRPDSTVSSTVDSQTVNIPATEQTSSEITKDVTSSSDAVPTIHGNVKPEEIRNVSEINFCKAETSVSPPKKIKLIRQKITTGTSNRESAVSQISVLAEKEQCQSTSSDNNTVNLPIHTAESSSSDNLSQSQGQVKPILDNSNCVLENQPLLSSKSHEKESTSEHPQPSINPSSETTDKESELLPVKLSSQPPSSPESVIADQSEELCSLPTPNLLDLISNVNDLRQGSLCNTYDSGKSIDYIPLRLSPRTNIYESNSNDLKIKDHEHKSNDTVQESNKSYLESQGTDKSKSKKTDLLNSELHSQSESSNVPLCDKELAPTLNVLVSKSSQPINFPSKNIDFKSNIIDNQLTTNIDSEVKCTDVESKSLDIKSKTTLLESTSNELETKHAASVSISRVDESLTTVAESSSPELKSKETVQESISIVPESLKPVAESISTVQKSASTELKSESSMLESISLPLDSTSIVSVSKIPVLDSSETVLKSKSSVLDSPETGSTASTSCKVEAKSIEQEAQSTTPEAKDDIESSNNTLQSRSHEVESIESETELKSSLEQSSSKTIAEPVSEESVSIELEPSKIILENPAKLELEKESEKNVIALESTVVELKDSGTKSNISVSVNCQSDEISKPQDDRKKVPPIKLNLSRSSMSNLSESKLENELSSIKNNVIIEDSDSTKTVPKLTLKLKQPDEMKSPVPKLTIKPIKPPVEKNVEDNIDNVQQVPSVTKINIKPIVKPVDINDKSANTQLIESSEQLPSFTKLNIKPIPKPPEKINDVHRKSSSSEISESECSENDETTSTSDQASASDHGLSDVIPKVTIKLGKPGTESEGKFYTEKNVPKLTIKGIQQEEKLIISQSDITQPEKVPKLTIKTVAKTEGQPLSPKLTIKPLKPPDSTSKEGEIPKIKISTESFSSTSDGRESPHVPKITIKPVTRMDGEPRTPKKSTSTCDSPEHIPVVTKLNIKPILKPTDCGESSEGFDDKVPVVSKLNIKPVIKPKDNVIDSSVDDVPKITKLNIKPLKNPEDNSSETFKDCDELNADIDENSIPVVTKINIKPIVKPQEEEKEKDSENQSSETGNSSDDNGDHIPVVTKLNIKPIVKPDELQESFKPVSSSEQSIPTITKLNIKPLVKPGESSPTSPKKEHLKINVHSPIIPVVTKLNIKPVVKPEGADSPKSRDDIDQKSPKNPPLVMKINMKSVTENYNHESYHNESISSIPGDGLLSIAPRILKMSNEVEKQSDSKDCKTTLPVNDLLEATNVPTSPVEKSLKQNCVPESVSVERTSVNRKTNLNSLITIAKPSDCATEKQHSPKIIISKCDSAQAGSLHQDSTKEGKISLPNETHVNQEYKNTNFRSVETTESNVKQSFGRQKVPSVQNCTLLKKLLENTRDSLDKNIEVSQVVNCTLPSDRSESTLSTCKNIVNSEHLVELGKSGSDVTISRNTVDSVERSSPPGKVNDTSDTDKVLTSPEISENVTKPLEISICDKVTNQSSGQDSPRIILKINKTDHGPSAKIITEDVVRTDTLVNYVDNTPEILNDTPSPKKHLANSSRKQGTETSLNLSTGKRLRSSRIVENTDKLQAKRNVGKRPSSTETSPTLTKETELSVLQTKRLKLGQLLSGNKALTVSPESPPRLSPTKPSLEIKSTVKSVNHLNNENCSKNGNSKLHNILSNLQVKQMQSLPYNNTNCTEKGLIMHSDSECNATTSSSEAMEVPHGEKTHPELQQMIINENSDFRDFTGPEDTSQDPLEVENSKIVDVPAEIIEIPKPVELTPQPKKRGRPRKLPVSEGAKPPVVTLPVPALEERPQRSLRLMRERPTILRKPRGGRGRGRGARRPETPQNPTEAESITVIETAPEDQSDECSVGEIDPMSSRIKLPRMTEALDKMPSVCMTPLSSRRRNSSGTFSSGDTTELKIVLDNSLNRDDFPNTPEPTRGGRGRGSRGGRGRTPRGRGRARGGGRGAMYMKETLGIYGRVCGPATTTIQLFEEETCMMDDNATPAKPSHLLDEDSQGSVKSSTNESNKMKKSKFADLFDSNKVWTAADVKEYTWPPPDRIDGEPKVIMMIQEQVAMFLGVKSFKRRYPELKRRPVGGEERDYVLSKGLVTEALCDLGITAVDAGEVLDIMLSDYPHKYEEFRSHQRQRQLTQNLDESPVESKPDEKMSRVEIKLEKPVDSKPDVPKIDPEKTRQDMVAAAIASASEWNARANAARRGACADLQSFTILRARPRQVAPTRAHLRPPAGFYPHALLPGQYQHSYRVYTPDQLRYFPLNTVLAAPPAPVSVNDWSSESEAEWGSRCSSSDDSDVPTHHAAKRKKLTKMKRSSQTEASTSSIKEESHDGVVDTCRVCKLRLEANRKYTHERFLVCANCNAKLHPSCVDLNADTIRKCREYPWQCAECKTCCSCRQPADDDKMLFCDLCDRGFHIYCVGLDTVPSGRWHCVECSICKSCGARSPGGLSESAGGSSSGPAAPADWHHQTRRGPGGHKVYSHSLCTPCARAYRIGRYCPLCERSFIGPKGTMQLVICKLCDRQLHQDCVRQTGAVVRVMDYTCGWCRRGGITSRAAAVRLAPRTIATLFMAKRRFNKYAHRQYMESRMRPDVGDMGDVGDLADGSTDPPSPTGDLV